MQNSSKQDSNVYFSLLNISLEVCNNPNSLNSPPLGVKQSSLLLFFCTDTILFPKKINTNFQLDQRLKVSLVSQWIPKNSTEKPFESQFHYTKLVSHVKTPNSTKLEDQLHRRSQLVSLRGELFLIIFKKKKRKKEKQKVDIDQHLCTYSTPCSRMQGYFILW